MLPPKISQTQETILVTEYCSHGDLDKYMKKTGLKHLRDHKNLAKKLVKSVVKGLQALLEHNFFHRDVKASNVFVTGSLDNPTFKLGDFGLVAKREERNRDVCGTPTAMAPEMDGKREYDEKVDIWSLGILMYSKLLGRKPYSFDVNADTQTRIKAIAAQQSQALYSDMDCISRDAQDLVRKMLEIDPSRRIDLNAIESHPFLHDFSTVDSGVGSTLLSGSMNGPHYYPHPATSTRAKFSPVQELPENSHMGRANGISLSSIQPRASLIGSLLISMPYQCVISNHFCCS